MNLFHLILIILPLFSFYSISFPYYYYFFKIPVRKQNIAKLFPKIQIFSLLKKINKSSSYERASNIYHTHGKHEHIHGPRYCLLNNSMTLIFFIMLIYTSHSLIQKNEKKNHLNNNYSNNTFYPRKHLAISPF